MSVLNMSSLIRQSLNTVVRKSNFVRTVSCVNPLNTISNNNNTLNTRRFASERLKTIKQELLQGLEEDIADLTNYSTNDATSNEIKEYIEENKWTVDTDIDLGECTLTKVIGSTTIEVNFEFNTIEQENTGIDETDDMIDENKDNEDEEENESSNFPAQQFEVDIRTGYTDVNYKELFMRTYAIANEHSSLEIEQFTFNEEEANAFDLAEHEHEWTAKTLKYSDLIESVQDSLRDWFDELGIDDRLAMFIQQYSYQQRTLQQIEKEKKLIQVVKCVDA